MIGAGRKARVNDAMGRLRLALAEQLDLIPSGVFAFACQGNKLLRARVPVRTETIAGEFR